MNLNLQCSGFNAIVLDWVSGGNIWLSGFMWFSGSSKSILSGGKMCSNVLTD